MNEECHAWADRRSAPTLLGRDQPLRGAHGRARRSACATGRRSSARELCNPIGSARCFGAGGEAPVVESLSRPSSRPQRWPVARRRPMRRPRSATTAGHAQRRPELQRRRRRPLGLAVARARHAGLDQRRGVQVDWPRADGALATAERPAAGHRPTVPAARRRRSGAATSAPHDVPRRRSSTAPAGSTARAGARSTTQPRCDDVQGASESLAAFVDSPGRARRPPARCSAARGRPRTSDR